MKTTAFASISMFDFCILSSHSLKPTNKYKLRFIVVCIAPVASRPLSPEHIMRLM